MALEFATGTISIGTGAINTNYSVTSKTGTWKAAIFFWSGQASTTDASGEADIQPGIGVAVSSTSRWVLTGQSDHSPTTSATDRYQYNGSCISVIDISGVVVGHVDFVSFNANGFTLIIDDVMPFVLEVGYILLGGADITNAATGTFQLAAATGDSDYTTQTTFTPDFALFGSRCANDNPNSASFTEVNLCWSFGAATASSQAVLSGFSSDAAATSITSSYCRAGEMFARQITNNTTVQDRASLTSFLSTGFRINRLEGTTQYYVSWLALKGGSYTIGDFLTSTTTTPFVEAHGMGATPKGAMFCSSNRAQSTQDVASGTNSLSIGASDGTNNYCQMTQDLDASALMACFLAVEHNECYINASIAAPQAVEGLGHVTSFDATNINLTMSTGDPSQSFVWYAAFGDTLTSAANAARPRITLQAIKRGAYI